MRLLSLFLLAAAAFADDAIEAFGHKWSVPIGADWKVTPEGVMQLTVPRPQEKPRRPKQFATLQAGPYKAVTLDVDVKRNEKSLILVYAYKDDAHFNYAHLSVDAPATQPVHNGIFHVYGGDRVRISPEEGPGSLPTSEWAHVRLEWSGKTGEVKVTVDGKTTGALRGVDLSIKEGTVGLGSFFETAQFRNFKLNGTR